MGNKLKELFSDENNSYNEILEFEGVESLEQFEQLLEQVHKDGQIHCVKGVKRVRTKVTKGMAEYPISDEQDVAGVFVGPYYEPVKFPIKIDGQCEDFVLNRVYLEDRIELRTNPDSVVVIKIIMISNGQTIKISYNTHLNNAKNVEDLIREFKRAQAFFGQLFSKNQTEEIRSLNKYFAGAICTYERWKSVGEVLNININPQSIQYEDTQVMVLEKLYIWLKEKTPLRKNAKTNYIENATSPNVDGLELGQELFATYMETRHIEIGDCEFDIYIVNCLFNAIISEIIEEGEKVKITFVDSESKPMFISELGFATRKDAENEIENIMQHQDSYRKAEKLGTYLRSY